MPVDRVDPGICAGCRHGRKVNGTRSTFWLCELSASDPSFPRYPALPVRQCRGFRPSAARDPRTPPDPPPPAPAREGS